MSFDVEPGDFAIQPAQTQLSADSAREDWSVACEVTLRQVLSARLTSPVQARLNYSSDDPYAVSIEFRPAGEEPVTWVFSRDLLMAGMRIASGSGDVRVWPVGGLGGDGRSVCLAFESPAGRALFEAETPPLRAWLTRTCRLVPPGCESEHLRWDETIDRLSRED